MGMKWTPCLALLICTIVAPLHAADMLKSHLGHEGPAFAPGMAPSVLGWGPDEKPYPGEFVVNPKDLAEMAWVPPGEFLMGSPPAETAEYPKDGRFADERPQHFVRLTKGFWLYRHEVTNRQYRAFKPEHHSGKFTEKGLMGRDQSQDLDKDLQPAVAMGWRGASEYSAWTGGRLPTEAEWEYAGRAGNGKAWWWWNTSLQADKCANLADKLATTLWPQWPGHRWVDGYAVSAPVGSYHANAFGLFDMSGNVEEWCADWYAADCYATSPKDDPAGPAAGAERVLRGGSWRFTASFARSATRDHAIPDAAPALQTVGFRCAVTP